jgi:hypothetical protein
VSLHTLPLREAVLLDVTFHWQSGRCTCSFQPDELEQHVLIFSGVRELHVPCQQPWGPSSLLNSVREKGEGLYELELQSGDVIRIAAAQWEFRKERRSAPRE